jgi:methylenetetrahydrofolate reductase (NADPH)
MSFAERLGKGFVVTGEVEPAAAVSDSFLTKAGRFKKYADAINVIDSPFGEPQVSSLAASIVLKQNGFEPILQLCARDRNRTAIINDLLGAKLLGIDNVLAITGDYPKESKPVYEYDSVRLLRLIKEEMPQKYKGFRMTVGAAYNPLAEPQGPELIKLEKKLKYADFIQTQMVFDFSQLDNPIVKKNRKKMLVGVLPLLPGMAEFFNKSVPGVVVPDKVAKSIKSADDGIKLANSIARQAKAEGFGGVHLMVFKVKDRIGEILKGVV